MSIILRYKKGSKEIGESYGTNEDLRMWDVLSPLPGYDSQNGRFYPTFMLGTLKQMGLLNKGGH